MECWAHAESQLGFSLKELRAIIGVEVWSDYHRIRLVNHLRRLGPEAAGAAFSELLQAGCESPIWEEDELLMPVLEDDALLFDAVEEDFDEVSCPTGKGKGGA